MKTYVRSSVLMVVVSLPLSIPLLQAQRNAPAATAIANSIAGVVQGGRGPEAGVWVIAETKDLPTNFI